ncbi:MAG TPA: tetratricopeptide repeat protein [Planktothrix sp.]|jgi:tetratricopeptide (TPR) repeat protein
MRMLATVTHFVWLHNKINRGTGALWGLGISVLGKIRNPYKWSFSLLLAATVSLPVVAAGPGPDYDESTTPPASLTPASSAGKSADRTADLRQAANLMVQGAYEKATSILLDIVTTDPDNVQAQAQLGYALGRQYKLDEADEHFDKALALDPKNAVAHCGKAMVTLYRVEKNQLGTLTREQALHQAGRECNKALDADPRVVEAHYLLGMVFKEEKRYDLSLQAFSGAIRLDPHYVRAFNQRAAVEVIKGSLTEAISDYKESLTLGKNLTAYQGLAEIYMKQSRFDEAMTELNDALTINPDSVQTRLALARAMQSRGNSAAAIAQYEQVIRIKPEDSEAYLAIVSLRNGQGEYNMAIEQLQQAQKLNEHDKNMHGCLLDELLLAGRIDDLLKEARNGLSASPDSVTDIYGLAMGYYAASIRNLDPARLNNADFISAAKMISDAANSAAASLSVSLANAMMQALAGKTVDLSRFVTPETTTDRLLNANLLMALHRYQEASVMMSTAVTSAASAGDVMRIGDEALVMHDLDGAEEAYKKGLTFTGQDLRARRGLARASELRQQATDELARAKVLMDNKQYRVAVDKLADAVSANPRFAPARQALAESLEKQISQAPDPLSTVKEALAQYQAYVALSPALTPRELERVQRRIDRLESAVNHAQGTTGEGLRALLMRLSVR